MFNLDITTEIISNILSNRMLALGRQAFSQLKQGRISKQKVKDYLFKLTNRVSYFVTYRILPQHIDEAYVKPLILDFALSKTYISPENYERIITKLEDYLYKNANEKIDFLVSSGLGREEKIEIEIKYIPLEELIKEYHSILILGDVGSGKSALLSYLCFSRLQLEKPRLPIFADSHDIINKDINNIIYDTLASLGLNKKDMKWLEDTITLYIDGIDELEYSRFKEITSQISMIRSEFPNIELTVSCRSSAYHNELSYLQEIGILPFDEIQAESYIRKWFYGTKDKYLANKLINHIHNNDELRDLSSQPLLLALMCNAYRRYLNISRRQTTLFDQCIESLLWQWDADRIVTRISRFADLDLEKKKWLHSKLAMALHNNKKRFCDKRFILSILNQELPRFGIDAEKSTEVLSELCSNHGILVELTQDTFGFCHFALQEYLTAKWFASEQRWKSLFKRDILIDSWWENVIALCLAILSDATDAMNCILDNSQLNELEKLKILSNSLKFDPLVSPDLRYKIIRRILYYYHNGNIKQKELAFNMLIGIDDEWSGKIIINSLNGRLPKRDLPK